MERLNIIKIGGNVIDSKPAFYQFLIDFARLRGPKILIHGGGKLASDLSRSMGIEPVMIEGRRVTDAKTLEIVTMVYGGLINKNIVADLQAKGCNAIGLTGADANIIPAKKRKKVGDIDYGYAGDLDDSLVNVQIIKKLLDSGLTPVLAPLTHDKQGFLLNTNADTIASSVAVAMGQIYKVTLSYCFEKKGVLSDLNNNESVIPQITRSQYLELRKAGMIVEGMIPKLDNAFDALSKGVSMIRIGDASMLESIVNQYKYAGTILIEENE